MKSNFSPKSRSSSHLLNTLEHQELYIQQPLQAATPALSILPSGILELASETSNANKATTGVEVQRPNAEARKSRMDPIPSATLQSEATEGPPLSPTQTDIDDEPERPQTLEPQVETDVPPAPTPPQQIIEDRHDQLIPRARDAGWEDTQAFPAPRAPTPQEIAENRQQLDNYLLRMNVPEPELPDIRELLYAYLWGEARVHPAHGYDYEPYLRLYEWREWEWFPEDFFEDVPQVEEEWNRPWWENEYRYWTEVEYKLREADKDEWRPPWYEEWSEEDYEMYGGK